MNQQPHTGRVLVPIISKRVISSQEVHNDFVELSKILKNLEGKYANLEKTLTTERNQIPILKNNIGTIEFQLKETTKKLEDTELNNNRLVEENSKIPILNKKITNLESKLNENKNQLIKANRENVILRDSLQPTTIELDSLSEENSKIPILNEKIKNLESQLNSTSRKFQENINQLKAANSEKVTLNNKLKQISTELNAKNAVCDQLSEENSKIPILNEKIKNLESELNFTSRKFQENINLFKAANSEKVALNNKLQQLCTELNAKNAVCDQLSEENAKISRLNAEISKLKKQFHQTSLENEDIKEKYEKLISESASLVLLKQTSLELENEISKCSQLSFENEELKKNCENLTAENSSLRVKQGDSEKTLMLNQSVNTLEQRLKHLTLQLEKEIAACIKLEAENQKLKSLSSTAKSESQQMEENIKVEELEEKVKQLSCDLEKEVSKNMALGEYNKQLDRLISGFKSKVKSENIATQSVENVKNSQEQLNNCSNFKVLIRDVTTEQILNPLEKTVIDLASKMSIAINRDDITNVRIIERKGLSEYSNKVSLLVDFKSAEMKTTFLSNRNKLRLNSSTKNIQLKDFFENEIYSLFQYANEHLRPNGFQRIWCTDNQVFARKGHYDAEIEIKSRDQVDILVKPNWRS